MNPSDHCLRDTYCQKCKKFNTSRCKPDVEVIKLGDAYRHTLMVLQNAPATVEGQLSALLHDTGKASTTEVLEGSIHSYGHEEVSGEIAEAVCKRLKFDADTTRKVRKLVENHMRPHVLSQAGTAGIRKFVREVGEELVDALLDLASADERGKIPRGDNVTGLRDRVKSVMNTPTHSISKKAILNGNEIMSILNIKPSPKIKEITDYLLDLEDTYAEKGQTLTKDIATKAIKTKFG